MPIDWNVLPLGKGKTRKQLKARKDRADSKAMLAFQDAVWARESALCGLENVENPSLEVARCQECFAIVVRDFNRSEFGQVHHIMSRRHKSTRYACENGRLLCRDCHNKAHGREF